MQKFLSAFILLCTVLFAAGCAKEDIAGGREEAAVVYSVNASALTRAAIDSDGAAANVTRFICEVYNGNNLYRRYVNVVAKGTTRTVFEIKLMKSQDYEVLFWADCSDGEADRYYSTSAGLKSVSLVDRTLGNDDSMDAFFAVDAINSLTGTLSRDIVLTRPFAQLNIITDDIDVLGGGELHGDIVPDQVTVRYSAPTEFNVSTGAAGAVAEISCTAAVYYSVSGKNAAPLYTLGMNYIFAGASKDVREIGFTALNQGKVLTSSTFSNIPLARNYRTNIIGSLLTAGASWKVVVSPDWNDKEYDAVK